MFSNFNSIWETMTYNCLLLNWNLSTCETTLWSILSTNRVFSWWGKWLIFGLHGLKSYDKKARQLLMRSLSGVLTTPSFRWMHPTLSSEHISFMTYSLRILQKVSLRYLFFSFSTTTITTITHRYHHHHPVLGCHLHYNKGHLCGFSKSIFMFRKCFAHKDVKVLNEILLPCIKFWRGFSLHINWNKNC